MIEFLPDNCPGASRAHPSPRRDCMQHKKCDDWSIRGLLSHSQDDESDGYGGTHEGLYLTSWELDLRCSRKSQGTTGGHLLLLYSAVIYSLRSLHIPRGQAGMAFTVVCHFVTFGFLSASI
eukprot:scaffold101759_cov55-Attheya_sp.AAC.1